MFSIPEDEYDFGAGGTKQVEQALKLASYGLSLIHIYMRGNGAMMTGWLQQGNTWYYLKDSGAMATGWNWVNAKCYYFSCLLYTSRCV